MRIAVLDDDRAQTDFVCQALTSVGHVCHAFIAGRALVHELRRQTFDLLVLDWNLPDMSGEEVLRWVRRSLPSWLPVLFITGRNRDSDISSILDIGADDYVVKPVSRIVLVARVSSLLRRAYQTDELAAKQRFDDFEFDVKLAKVRGKEGTVLLTQKEFDLALLLFRHMSRPLSRAHISEVVWKQAIDMPSRTIDTHISALRVKLNLRPEHGYRLAPIYGYGYRLERIGSAESG